MRPSSDLLRNARGTSPPMDDDCTPLKGTRLSVLVDEALPDIIVVSYVRDARVFRGVLLDASKRQLPCGITELNPAFDRGRGKPDDDILYAVNQRYAYTQHMPTETSTTTTANSTNRLKNNKMGKMTVRLRPRQVLCSKCKDICNENSESITRKRRAVDVEADSIPAPPPPLTLSTVPPAVVCIPAKRSANAPVTRSCHAAIEQSQAQAKSLLPNNALSGNVNKLNIDNNRKQAACLQEDERKLKRVILTRKKALDDSAAPSNNNNNVALNTRTIKICYGPQGEGTVLKIPAAIEVHSDEEEDDDEDDEEDVPAENVVDPEVTACSQRASRRAMKKAKKAKKKITLQSIGSPSAIGSSSPRYTVGSASPRHGLGNNSPRFVASLPALELTPTSRRRKHKVKHKKKHKEDRERTKHTKDEEVAAGGDKCLTQKLSINLKRLSGTYTTTSSVVAEATSSEQPEEALEEVEGDNEGEDTKTRNIKRKRGLYKQESTPSTTTTGSTAGMMMIVSPALASPREINVIS